MRGLRGGGNSGGRFGQVRAVTVGGEDRRDFAFRGVGGFEGEGVIAVAKSS